MCRHTATKQKVGGWIKVRGAKKSIKALSLENFSQVGKK